MYDNHSGLVSDGKNTSSTLLSYHVRIENNYTVETIKGPWHYLVELERVSLSGNHSDWSKFKMRSWNDNIVKQ